MNKLERCGNKPNCVCSEYPDDNQHVIEPIVFNGTPEEIKRALSKAITQMGGVINSETTSGLHAIFTSKFLRFKDDVNIRIDSENQHIHIRSASRTGYSDLGVNRKRMEHLRQLIGE